MCTYPESIFNYVQDPMCEVPTSVSFTNNSSGASAYIWDFGIYGSSNQQNPSLPFSQPANFNALLIAQNIFGCSDTSSKPIKVYAKPLAAYTPDSISGCPPLSYIRKPLTVF
ncbi:MAG: PKD domain-containing protein [Bacteroidetes bacterium]|nr:PKD domain-containing protein [Bacteroidota bacterium]